MDPAGIKKQKNNDAPYDEHISHMLFNIFFVNTLFSFFVFEDKLIFLFSHNKDVELGR